MNSDGANTLATAAALRRQAGDANGAAVFLREMIRLAPNDHEVRLQLAELLLNIAPREAVEVVEPSVRAVPGDVRFLTAYAIGLSSLGQHSKAAEAFGHVTRLEPHDPLFASNYCLALLRAGDIHSAVAEARRSLELGSQRPETHSNLGHALLVLEETTAAIEAFQTALGLNPLFEDAMIGLSRAYFKQGATQAGVGALHRAREVNPNSAVALSDLKTAEIEYSMTSGVSRLQTNSQFNVTDGAFGNQLLQMQYDPTINDDIAACAAVDWGLHRVAAAPRVQFSQMRSDDPDRTLRVGYVSADFYRHPVGWLGRAPIMEHDRRAVHVTLYANHANRDQITEELMRSADSFQIVVGMSDEALAQAITGDRIDILVDMSGHTGGGRLNVFAARPAPIQVSWLGYFATTGLPTMDYILLDDEHIAPGGENFFIEQVVRLPGGRLCYAPPPIDRVGLAARPRDPSHWRFGSFNNSSKLNDNVISLWARLLNQCPKTTTLLLKWKGLDDPTIQDHFREKFKRHGLAPERLEFDGRSPHEEMLAQYWDLDVALDPFPFCGGLTTVEALIMGVPVVTLPGFRPVSRQSHSILNHIGRAEWSAIDEDRYIEIALELVSNRDRLIALRRSLPEELTFSSVCGHKIFSRNLEGFYRQAWKSWLKTGATTSKFSF